MSTPGDPFVGDPVGYPTPALPPSAPPAYAAPAYGPPGPPGYHQPPRQTPLRTQAVWAFVLALLVFVPLLFVVSAAMAATVLVKGRDDRVSSDGRDSGRGLAIAALIIDAAALVGWIVLLIALVSGGFRADVDRTTSGQATEAGTVSVFNLQLGDCVNDSALTGQAGNDGTAADTTQVVPCDQPHRLELYHQFDVAGPRDDFPGAQAVLTAADRGCYEAFEDFVGIGYQQSVLDVYYYSPIQEGWDSLDDRRVTCLVGDPGGPTTGTLEGSGR